MRRKIACGILLFLAVSVVRADNILWVDGSMWSSVNVEMIAKSEGAHVATIKAVAQSTATTGSPKSGKYPMDKIDVIQFDAIRTVSSSIPAPSSSPTNQPVAHTPPKSWTVQPKKKTSAATATSHKTKTTVASPKTKLPSGKAPTAEIKKRAQERYPDDYSMQEYRMNSQIEAYNDFLNFQDSSVPDAVIADIKRAAIQKYPTDYSMQLYVLKSQIEAYKKVADTR